jgi:methyl-accepting chemotaxis protein
MTTKSPKKIVYKIVVPFLAIFLILVSLLVSGIVSYLSKEIENYLIDDYKHALLATQSYFTKHTDNISKLLTKYAKDLQLNNPDDPTIFSSYNSLQDIIIGGLQDGLQLVDEDGTIITEIPSTDNRGRVSKSVGVKKALTGINSTAFSMDDFGIFSEVIIPIRTDAKVIGAISATYRWDNSKCKNIKETINHDILFIANDQIIASSINLPPNKQTITIPAKARQAVLTDGKEFVGNFFLDGKEYVGSFAPLFAADHQAIGILIVAMSKEPLLAILHNVTSISLIYCAVGMAIISLISFLIAKGITEPIRQLMEVSSKVAKGDLNVTVPALSIK